MRVPVHVEPSRFFAIVSMLLLLILALVVVELAFKWLPCLWQRLAPIRTVRASILDIRHGDTGVLLISFSCNGETIDLVAPGENPASLETGCEGLLTYRGSTLLSFRQMNYQQ